MNYLTTAVQSGMYANAAPRPTQWTRNLIVPVQPQLQWVSLCGGAGRKYSSTSFLAQSLLRCGVPAVVAWPSPSRKQLPQFRLRSLRFDAVFYARLIAMATGGINSSNNVPTPLSLEVLFADAVQRWGDMHEHSTDGGPQPLLLTGKLLLMMDYLPKAQPGLLDRDGLHDQLVAALLSSSAATRWV